MLLVTELNTVSGFSFPAARFQHRFYLFRCKISIRYLGLQLVFANTARKKKGSGSKKYIENSTFLGQNKLRNL